MTRRRHDIPPERVTLLLILLLVSPLTTTPPAPIFVHAEHVLVQAGETDEPRATVALILPPPRGADPLGGGG